ncbi:hypothetical protein RCG17_22995 [Neobacillus sp. PS3-12]|uniref:hypothetical protein n=1 Tax=Neobacillus sp. PS3-12 TaxID=3070677 RepID=UPI0027E0401C|nr:hypothetical protein [Neobacillus sp. PS3-12]WML52226.1 hypothetical protein RCG17_22995 [Neobacillus sp. PS3-12]
MLLGRPYYETSYRLFGNIVLRWLIDQTLACNKKQDPVSSGLISSKTDSLCLEYDNGFLWNGIRFWSEWFMMKDDVITPWGHSWRKYVSCIPKVGLGDWDEWDAHFSVFIRNLYFDYWSAQFPSDLSPDVMDRFWTKLWITYARILNIDNVQATLDSNQSIISREVKTGSYNLSFLNKIESVLREMCLVNNIQWEGVEQPGWIKFSLLKNPMWGDNEILIDWDTPLVILSSVVGHKVEQQTIVVFLESMKEEIRQRLASIIKVVRNEPTELYEFWFPLENHQLEAGSEESMGQYSKIVGISKEIAEKLTNSGGIGPRPSAHVGDAYVVVSRYGKTLHRACEEALRELGDTQTMLRVADTGFRWETSYFYYWSLLKSSRLPLQSGSFFIAERRDSQQLYGLLTTEWLSQSRDLFSGLAEKSGKLADALLVAMKWLGMARTQDGAESEFLCLWIALERLGNGSHEYRNVIPKVVGTLWHLSMWSNLAIDKQIDAVEENREMMVSLLHDLGNLRNQEVAHRGQFRKKKDVRYATWMLHHLVNDLTRWLIHLLTNRDDIQTFDDLITYIDEEIHPKK